MTGAFLLLLVLGCVRLLGGGVARDELRRVRGLCLLGVWKLWWWKEGRGRRKRSEEGKGMSLGGRDEGWAIRLSCGGEKTGDGLRWGSEGMPGRIPGQARQAVELRGVRYDKHT